MVNLYKLYFLSSHFSSQPNKRVFHPSTFLPSQPNTYKRKLNPSTFLSFHFSILSPFSILPLFHSPNQTNPKIFSRQQEEFTLPIIHVDTSSGWWRDSLSTSSCHDSPGARGMLWNVAPNNDSTITFKPSIHCGKGKYEATTCKFERIRNRMFQ